MLASKDDWIDKWTNHLTGLGFRLAYGLQSKLTDRHFVMKVEEALRKAYEELQVTTPIPGRTPPR